MTIRIKRYVEPLSLASESETPFVIESDAYRQVCTDLEMYTNGQILGRSFLIAGHRGAGKTTMLRQAVREVASRIQYRGQTSRQLRPLFIALHGPDLLEAARTTPDEAKSPDKVQTPSPAAPLEPPPPAELRRFLERITSGLYVEAAHEFARCFWRRANAVTNEREKSELLELAADLQVQLDRQPDLDRLRDYWSRVKALDHGVLFDGATEPGRGVAEVTALFSIGRAMRTFAGTTQSQMDTEANRRQEGSVSLVTIDGQSLLTPLLGLASGALVWNAVPGDSVMPKAIAGILTGLGAVLALKVSATRSRASTQSWKETFIPKDDPGSLYRVLPGLIERFQRVGLFPIFVVDELDKVPHLGAKIDSLLGYMKQFVTERTFFCFVTNRSFYQQATVQVAGSAYSTLHTRFGDSVFVHYSPNDLHRYLTDIMDVNTDGLPPADVEKANKAADMLRYLLLSRSYMHPYDLRRELAQWQDQTGLVEEKDDALTDSGRYQREVAMQVAVEVVYNGLALAEHIRDPITAQTVLDALYYPVRQWRDGVEEFSVSQQELTAYLIERTGIQEETAKFETAKLIRPELQKTLLEEVTRMLELLCDSGALAREAAGKVPQSIQNMLQTLPPLMGRLP